MDFYMKANPMPFPGLKSPILLFFQQGSVFFPLSDGSSLLYNVTGVSEAPKAISNIVRDVQCKTNYTELLTINNWLKKAQR